MAASPAAVARPSSSAPATRAPTDAAPSLALAPTVKTVARSAGGLRSLRVANSADEQRAVDDAEQERAAEQDRPRPGRHRQEHDAERGER